MARSVDLALQADMRDLPSGQYNYTIQSGFIAVDSSNDRIKRTTGETSGTLLTVNGAFSPFGRGWGLAGMEWLVNNPDGSIMLIDGGGTTHRENPASADIPDIVPTVLFAAGLPVARDMDGRVLTDAFDDEFLRRTPLSVIQTYEAKQIVVRRGGT